MSIARFAGQWYALSNFGGEPFVMNGSPAVPAEHHFQALKAAHAKQRAWVYAAPNPGESKRRGRRVDMRVGWDGEPGLRDVAMWLVLEAKFNHPANATVLLATGDEPLIEGNTWHDTYWGRCICERHGSGGTNRLGQMLEFRRDIVRDGHLRDGRYHAIDGLARGFGAMDVRNGIWHRSDGQPLPADSGRHLIPLERVARDNLKEIP